MTYEKKVCVIILKDILVYIFVSHLKSLHNHFTKVVVRNMLHILVHHLH